MTEKKRIDLGVVILHYNNVDDTLECVESFRKKLDTDNYVLLVFDNCSPNGSGKILLEKLSGIKNVEVYLNDKNLGFGGGNNKGIQVLKEKYEPKYLVLSNNDIVMIDDKFFKKIDDEYNKSQFAELGPLIFTADGRYDSNPIFDKPYYKDVAADELKELKRKLKSYKFHYVKLHNFIRRLRFKLSKKLRNKRRSQLRKDRGDGRTSLVRRENIVLHGCFMIFSEQFFKYYDGINLHSFMYAEEDILFAQIASKGMKTVFNPDLIVYHKEDRSIKDSYKNDRKRTMFVLDKSIEANIGYINYLSELEEEGFSFKE